MYIHVHVYIHKYMYVHIYTQVHEYTCTYTCTYIYTSTCVYTSICIYIYIHVIHIRELRNFINLITLNYTLRILHIMSSQPRSSIIMTYAMEGVWVLSMSLL